MENELYEKNKIWKIICPKCEEDVRIKIKNYKIELYDCKNYHYEIMKLNEFKKSQFIDKSKILCNICKMNNANNNIYICTKCKINLCQKCIITHKHENDNINYIINYNNKSYICKYHNKEFIKYCNECRKNLCIFCINDHINKNHNLISYENIIPNINKLKDKINNLRKEIDIIKKYIDVFIKNLIKVKENLEIYFDIYNNIINNYNIHNINYEMLQNINEINNIKKFENIEKLNIYDILNIYYDMFSDYVDIKNENFCYSGQYIDNIKHGKGLFYSLKDKIYSYFGHYKCDKMDGKGKLYFEKGDKYEGDFKDDKMDGKGILCFKNGDKYEGDFKDNKMEGKGKFYSNNFRYEGDFKNNKKDGFIKIYLINKNELYFEGIYKNNEKNGKGKLIIKILGDVNIYEGNYKNGNLDGKGIHIMTNENKNIYFRFECQFKNGKAKYGTIYDKNNNKIYEGGLKRYLPNGKGIKFEGEYKYEGNFKDGKLKELELYMIKIIIKYMKENLKMVILMG